MEYIILQKAKIARDLKNYEKGKQKDEGKIQELFQKEMNEKTEKFLRQETKVLNKDNQSEAGSSKAAHQISNMNNGKDKELPSFWVPNLTPSTKDKINKKPNTVVTCPMSGKPLKSSHLIPITFTLADPKCTDPMKALYKCAVSGDILTNSSRCVVLRTS